MSWTRQQATSFAKRIAESETGRAWTVLSAPLREAVIGNFVLGIVVGQDSEAVEVSAITDLYAMVIEALARRRMVVS